MRLFVYSFPRVGILVSLAFTAYDLATHQPESAAVQIVLLIGYLIMAYFTKQLRRDGGS